MLSLSLVSVSVLAGDGFANSSNFEGCRYEFGSWHPYPTKPITATGGSALDTLLDKQSPDSIKFESGLWTEPQTIARPRMLYDLFHHRLALGMSRAAVLKVIGKPFQTKLADPEDATEEDTDWYFTPNNHSPCGRVGRLAIELSYRDNHLARYRCVRITQAE